MRVYVGTYGKYNNGSIAGAWLDLEDYADNDEFYLACIELHKDEADPEFMFQDWEDIPENLISESWISEEAFELAAMDEDKREMYDAFIECFGTGTVEQAEEAFRGKYDSEADFAYEFATETGAIDEDSPMFNYIDWEAYYNGELSCSFTNHDGYFFRSDW